MTGPRPIRILQVLCRMNRAGLETWLMHVLRHIDRGRFGMDFLVNMDRPGAFDEEIRCLGSRLLPCGPPQRPWAYARAFRRTLAEFGPYSVVHSHVHHFSGFVLRLAAQAGVPVRIAHSHLDTAAVDARAGLPRRVYLSLMKRWIRRYATTGLAASRQAATALFGAGWHADPRRHVLHYGIDLQPFSPPAAREAIRAELGIPAGAFVVGHVGRFEPQKNHPFLVDIAVETIKREPNAMFLLVGDGPLRPTIQGRATHAGIAANVLFTGVRSDVPRLMCEAMDVFLLPSRYEGLPVVGIEAQAAGLPCVISDTVTPEVAIVPGLVRRLPLSHTPAAWADAVLSSRRGTFRGPAAGTLPLAERSPFNIKQTLAKLEETYAAAP